MRLWGSRIYVGLWICGLVKLGQPERLAALESLKTSASIVMNPQVRDTDLLPNCPAVSTFVNRECGEMTGVQELWA